MRRALTYRAPTGDAVPGALPADDYLAKLVKYVPAEVIAFFTPIAAFVGADKGPLVAITVAAAVGTIFWTYVAARSVPPAQRPRWYSYVLALVAFGVWAITISTGLRDLIGLSEVWSGVVLGVTVLFVPGIDLLISRSQG